MILFPVRPVRNFGGRRELDLPIPATNPDLARCRRRRNRLPCGDGGGTGVKLSDDIGDRLEEGPVVPCAVKALGRAARGTIADDVRT